MAKDLLRPGGYRSTVARHRCGVDLIKSGSFQFQKNSAETLRYAGPGVEPARTFVLQAQCNVLFISLRKGRLEFFILWKLGHATAGASPEQRLWDQHRPKLYVRK